MTIGEYLKQLFEQKEISVKTICERAEIKSRNTIYRLFQNYYSNEKTAELVNRITAVFEFSEEEIRRIDELITDRSIFGFFINSRKVLSNIYKENIPCGFEFEDKTGKKVALRDILSECDKSDKAVIAMSDIDDIKIIGDIRAFLEKNKTAEVYNHVGLKYHKNTTAYEIYSIIALTRFGNYIPYITDKVQNKSIHILRESGGKRYAAKIEYFNKSYHYISSEITEDFYNYELEKLAEYNSCCCEVKRKMGIITDFTDLIREMHSREKGSVYFSEGAPCFGVLSYDVLYDMLKDINYMGFPAECGFIEELTSAAYNREQTFLSLPESKRRFIVDEPTMLNMIENGIAFDHLESFKPMTEKHLRMYFEWVSDVRNKYPGKMMFRFIKKGYKMIYPFVYYKGNQLYMYCPEPSCEKGFVISICSRGVFEIMDDFMEYVWENFTLTEDESADIVRDMIEKTYG